MRYISVCSGIEAATVAWHHMGWTPAWFSEIEKFPSAVLAHHYPEVRNLGDMTQWERWPDEPIDLLVGGTPCQSFSVAGLRKGLHDPRGGLMLTFLEIAQRYRPRWVVWENVPGVLSSNGGRDFGAFLGALGELGYGWAYRILDAQWFGVAQRRRRVFVVGCLGDQASAAAVLFESESVQRNPAPSREKGQGSPRGVGGGPADGSISGAVTRKWAKGSGDPAGDECYNMVAQPVAFHHNAQASQLPTDARDTSISDSLTVSQQAAVAQPVAFKVRGGVEVDSAGKAAGKGYLGSEETAFTLAATQDQWVGTPPAMQVRRLTPVECERLQGFPDNFTNIPWRGKPESPDGPRYKALGNSMAVPCMKWIGERINAIEEKLT
jgi:DNA (cytosine-5)-methyltransferase 1